MLLADLLRGKESSSPRDFVDVNGTAFFVADDENFGIELWQSDGTSVGTRLVKDIRPGSPYGYPAGSNPTHLTNVAGTLFFVADDGQHGIELWKSDGTSEGTVLVKDINPRASDGYAYGSFPSNLIGVNGNLFFTADDGISGVELWKSDGTAEGTVMVKDIYPAASYGGANDPSPSNLTNVNGIVFFTTNDGENGEELWKSDGTAEGTILVRDVNPESSYGYPYGSSPSNLTNLNGTLLFTANDAQHGEELWKSDGTAAGTVMVTDINATEDVYGGTYGSSPSNLASVGELLFFSADDGKSGKELWKTDGTIEGTLLVKDVYPGSGGFYNVDVEDPYDFGFVYGPFPSSPKDLTASQGRLFFTANDGVHGRELWKSDGTAEGTTLVADLTPNESDSSIYYPTDVQGTLFFVGEFDGAIGRELWSSDGTSGGTDVVADFFSGDDRSDLSALTNVGGTLFFAATDDKYGTEPWTAIPGVVLQGRAFVDLDGNGVLDQQEPRLDGFTVFLDQNGNGQLDVSEPTTSTNITGAYQIGVEPGIHIIRSEARTGFVQTFPQNPGFHTATVDVDETISQLDFAFELTAPTIIELADESDSGISNDDNITSFNNRTEDVTLEFEIQGVARDALVRLFDNGNSLGFAFADGDSVTIRTDGRTEFADGAHEITSTQIVFDRGIESPSSVPLTVIVDTVAPADLDSAAPVAIPFGEPFEFDPNSPDENMPGVTMSLVDAPEGMIIDSNGIIRWTPTADQQGPQTFNVRIADAAGNATARKFELAVLGAIPAFPDSYTVGEDEMLIIDAASGVLGNDGADTNGSITAVVVAQPRNGSLRLSADGSFTYTPDADFNGTDGFVYVAQDGDEVSNESKVTITVESINDLPRAGDDLYRIEEDAMLTVDANAGLLANDSDVDGPTLTAELVEGPTNGTIAIEADGGFTYAPQSDFSGTDAFTYLATDESGGSTLATVTVTVDPVNDAPVAVDDAFDVNEDEILVIAERQGVLANDRDADGDTIVASLVSEPSSGSITLNEDGSFSYTPLPDFFGLDSFTYQLSDGTILSDVATVTVMVTSQPDPPTAADDRFEVMKDEGSRILDVLVNDSTEPDDGQTLTIVNATQGSAGGIVEISTDGSVIEYAPPPEFSGTETFVYTVQDSDGLTDQATVTISVTDFVPNSVSGFVYIDADNDGTRDQPEMGVGGALVTLTGINDVGASVSTSVLTSGDGSYSFNNLRPGTYAITQQQPEALVDGQDTAGSLGATADDDRFSQIVLASDDHGTQYNFAERGLRAEYISLRMYLASSPPMPELLRDLMARGEQNVGNTRLARAIRDGGSDEFPTFQNNAPVARNDVFSVNEDEELVVDEIFGLLGNDTDVDGDQLSAVLNTEPSNGQLTLESNGSFTYLPDADFDGTDTFTYRASDGVLESSELAVTTITIDPVNDSPLTIDDVYSLNEDDELVIPAGQGVLSNDVDAEGDLLTVQLVVYPSSGQVVLNADGSFVYTPNARFSGSDSFTYITSDGSLVSDEATVTIMSAFSDAPL